MATKTTNNTSKTSTFQKALNEIKGEKKAKREPSMKEYEQMDGVQKSQVIAANLAREAARAAKVAGWAPVAQLNGARVIKRFTPRLSLVERTAHIEALKLDVTVQLYHAEVGEASFESKDKRDAITWIKAHKPLKGARPTGAKKQEVMLVRASRAWCKLAKAANHIVWANVEDAKAVEVLMKTLNDMIVRAGTKEPPKTAE